MAFLRRTPTRHLLALCAALFALAAAGAALAIAGSGGPKPPDKPLSVAVRDALNAPPVDGVTARVKFVNHLVSSSSFEGAGPILSGATGRMWATKDGRARLELQSSAGDAQLVSDGTTFWAYDGKSNTVYHGRLPRHRAEAGAGKADRPATLKEVQDGLVKLAENWDVLGASPTNLAGRPAYAARLQPKDGGGLLGAAAVAWDAANGVPLNVALYARGQGDPVLELQVTDVSFGPVSSGAFDVSPPKGAKRVAVSTPGADSAKPGEAKDAKPVTGLPAVRRRVGFDVAAPPSLAGLPRDEVRAPGADQAVVTYGKGLGTIVVLEQRAEPGAKGPHAGESAGGLNLPAVSIGGAPGRELDTALGTAIQFERGGVQYTVLGSVAPDTARAAARAL
ncbi:MAG: hypothetical protein QOE65_1547 [Solirubrobacteraceae bacterium]|nr:hypothetical protein [Solirubrobacteraceae bacterium]